MRRLPESGVAVKPLRVIRPADWNQLDAHVAFHRSGDLTRLASSGLASSHDDAFRIETAPFRMCSSRARISLTAFASSASGVTPRARRIVAESADLKAVM